MDLNHLLSVGVWGILLVACGGAPNVDKFAHIDTKIYQAHGIDNRQIHFVWFEVPSDLSIGRNDIRVFMARTDPPGMLVPTEAELPCIIGSEKEYLELRAVTLPFEFDGKQLEGSYTWKACASCVECYMDWDTTLEIIATLEQDLMLVSIGIRHMGHNVQDDYLQIELEPEKPSSREPRILCRRAERM